MGLNKTKRNILLTIGLIVLAAFIYYIITMRRSFVRYSERIPYVWNDDFNLTLRQYINTAPTRNVLVLTGPYQSGKSRAMDVMATDLAAARHFVINCDLSTAKTPEDIISLFKIAVINGLSAVHPYLSSSQINKAADVFKPQKMSDKEREIEENAIEEEKELAKKEASSMKPPVKPTTPEKTQTTPEVQSKQNEKQISGSPSPSPSQTSSGTSNDKKSQEPSKSSPTSNTNPPEQSNQGQTQPTYNRISETEKQIQIETETSTNTFSNKDPLYGHVFNALSHVLDVSLIRPYSFTKFIDYLESMKNYIRPVLFVHDLDRFKKTSPALYSSFFARLSRRPLYKDFVPVVCEIRDSSFRLSTEPVSPSILFTEITPLRDPTRDLVVKYRVFSQIELRKIMNAFGGHGGTIDRVYEDIKNGMSIDDSIQKQQRAVEDFLRRKLNGSFPEPLYEICMRNGTARITNLKQLMSLKPLFASGHLYLSSDSIVKMAHTGVKNALCSGYI